MNMNRVFIANSSKLKDDLEDVLSFLKTKLEGLEDIITEEETRRFLVFKNFESREKCLKKGSIVYENENFLLYMKKPWNNTSVFLAGELESKLEKENFCILNKKKFKDKNNKDKMFITFSERDELNKAIVKFKNDCQYADRKSCNECCIYINFNPKNDALKNVNAEEDPITKELEEIYSFGGKVVCYVDVSRNEHGEYEGKAFVEYYADEDGIRVCN
jgi:hypothetical protein